MKRVTILQNYYLTAEIGVEVPDNYTKEEILNAVRDFPINATIESMLDEDSDLNEIKVTNLILEQLITGEEAGDFVVLDENGRNILL
jgi:hypothetical protein